ncbi:hypothetical protein ALC56_03745 [Trachymyrmex septentrionalis]|uniref:Uncharacterized protein n=1 Tax=Trachymyrmex septentrionalis TaxID=34720 RepID=A0A195FM95_9HYME|nr:hypothetical protein ALC56_03745 [Trachymyrmex septentrionalis]
MDKIIFDQTTVEEMTAILTVLQQQYGELKFFSSQALQENSCFIIDEILRIITSFLRNQIGMYDIKIFSQRKSNYLPTFAKCYNYLLLNTNFTSQSLLKHDLLFGHAVGIWPTLSPYLFIQIIWHSKCEDLLIESLMHIPLDLCVEILDITFKHISKLIVTRAKRFIFHLTYKLYNKCLWLHLGTISAENVTKNFQKLLMYFEISLHLIINSIKHVTYTSHDLLIEKYVQHGILVKNILYCIKMCMYSKIKNYLENYNLTRFFKLTYGNYYNNYAKYYQTFPASKIKSIIERLDHKLATVLLNQIRRVDCFEYRVWKSFYANEITVTSLHRSIIIDCHNLREFMKQNDFLVKNEQTYLCLKQLIDSRKSEEYILTIQELCHSITEGKLHGMKELIMRYEEWDLCTLDFIRQKRNLLRFNDFYVILEYLYYKFAYLHTKAKKYQVYVSVLKILNYLKEQDLHFVILKYMKQHFDDNCLEDLYNEKSFDAFIWRNLFIEKFNDSQSMRNAIAQRCRSFLTFILLNPKAVLSKLIFYELDKIESSDSILFQHNMIAFFLRNYYSLKKGQCNVLTYILKHMILKQGMDWHINYKTFITKVLDYQMMTADDVINELYIPYLISDYIEEVSMDNVLSHILSIVQKMLFTKNTKCLVLIIILLRKASLLRRLDINFSKFQIARWIKLIDNIVDYISKKCSNLYKNSNKNFHQDQFRVEPLDITKAWRQMNALNIIREYEKRYIVVYRQLRVDSRCHPELRKYVQSFSLDREVFIRHMILHCIGEEYATFMCDLIVKFWYYLGWTDEMMAYENIMRITIDVSQIALTYMEMFPKDTFIMLLFAIVHLSRNIAKNLPLDKYKAIRRILLKTFSSMSHMANRTQYRDSYNDLLKYIQEVDPYMSRQNYFKTIFHKIITFLEICEPLESCLYENW